MCSVCVFFPLCLFLLLARSLTSGQWSLESGHACAVISALHWAYIKSCSRRRDPEGERWVVVVVVVPVLLDP
ncbi:hypothetical protein BZA05DRAFT_476984 [Tricharina praecox]|uniref:uncharacterized protein n=1 Tax=Tricharina praecox TaxID=43433 RepID=UPI00221E6578|nr:uncharacterized protein BZA05DRAFT_476984 [Tricharina praecox]KAI5844127.1 hypothetical protein BZA05DRAFT_476984 [Tricharina praecox]